MDRNDPRYTEGFVGRIARGVPVHFTTHLTKNLTWKNRWYNHRARRRSAKLGAPVPTAYEIVQRYDDCPNWARRITRLSDGSTLRREHIHRSRWKKIVPGHPKFL